MNFLIGYLYNRNGMATWCIETASCLQAAGHDITLVIAPGMEMMVPKKVNYFTIDAFRKASCGIFEKWLKKTNYYLHFFWPTAGDSFAGKTILKDALTRNKSFDLVFWNQTNLLDPQSAIPQWVVGWAYPIELKGYLKKLNYPSPNSIFKRIREQIYWYRTDNWGYENAAGVLAVSHALTTQLQLRNIRVAHCPPGIGSAVGVPTFDHENRISLLICARWLDEPRKQVLWLIDALSAIEHISEFDIHLIGEAAKSFVELVRSIIPHAQFHGLLTREELILKMKMADMLLFGSTLDDWGYVQIEAMSAGLTVFAPNQLPSSEIVPDKAYLFEPGSKPDFIRQLQKLLGRPDEIRQSRRKFYETFCQRYSSSSFANNLLAAVMPYQE